MERGEIRFRFVYGDEDAKAWGVGIDDWMILSQSIDCGNGICEWGESPESCPGDCRLLQPKKGIWIEKGESLESTPGAELQWNKIPSCDDCSKEMDLGFELDFYGEKYSRLWLNSNGNVSLSEKLLNYTPEPFCLDGTSMIAPFFADIDLDKGGELWWSKDPEGHYFIASWNSVPYFGCHSSCDAREHLPAYTHRWDHSADWVVN